MNTYRVWFSDGSAILVNACDKQHACQLGEQHLNRLQPLDDSAADMLFDDIVCVDSTELISVPTA